MRKIIILIVLAALLSYPVTGFASYRIELVNDSEFIIDAYLEKGNQIQFYYYGGLISVDKKMIKNIEASKLPYVEPEESEPALNNTSDDIQKSEGEKSITNTQDIDSVLKEKNRIESDIQSASAAMVDARSRGDKKEQDLQYNQLLSLQKQITDLRNSVMSANNNQMPDWWDQSESKTTESADVECHTDSDCNLGLRCIDGYCM